MSKIDYRPVVVTTEEEEQSPLREFLPRISCYTGLVLRNMTITVSEEVARWARLKAAEENTSVSRLVGRMLEHEMRQSDQYWRAYEKIKKIKPIPGFDASKRVSRAELYERRR